MAQLIIDVPDELAARVSAAIRETYPNVVPPGATDGQAMRAVVAWWTANLLSNYEVERVRRIKEQVVQAAQQDLATSVERTSEAAWAAVQSVLLAPLPPLAGVSLEDETREE